MNGKISVRAAALWAAFALLAGCTGPQAAPTEKTPEPTPPALVSGTGETEGVVDAVSPSPDSERDEGFAEALWAGLDGYWLIDDPAERIGENYYIRFRREEESLILEHGWLESETEPPMYLTDIEERGDGGFELFFYQPAVSNEIWGDRAEEYYAADLFAGAEYETVRLQWEGGDDYHYAFIGKTGEEAIENYLPKG